MAKKLKKESINFKGVTGEPGGRDRASKVPEGDYLVKIIGVEKRWKNDDRSNAPFFRWKMQINEGQHKGKTLYENTSLAPEALFNLRNLIFAVKGKNVAGKKVDFDPQALIGKVIAVSVEDNEFEDKEGKTRISSQIVDTRPKEEFEGDEDEEDEDDEDEEEDEDEEDEDDEEEEEDEDEELEEVDIEEL